MPRAKKIGFLKIEVGRAVVSCSGSIDLIGSVIRVGIEDQELVEVSTASIVVVVVVVDMITSGRTALGLLTGAAGAGALGPRTGTTATRV